jgi:hypothetical protein
MKIYGIEGNSSKQILLRIECDFPDCYESIKPNPNISESGWVQYGQTDGIGGNLIWDYCPIHARQLNLKVGEK